jgi:putative membrane protein
MIINSYKPFWGLAGELSLHLVPILVYVLMVCGLDLQFHLEQFNFPVSIVGILGTVIGLLLAFRTNSCYDRWWEARTLWGAIVNDSRTWVRQLIEFIQVQDNDSSSDPDLHRMAFRQIAWCHALTRNLRDQDPTTDLATFVDDAEIDSFQSNRNIPNDLLLKQAIDLRKLYEANRIEIFQFVELEKTLSRLTNSMGGCERIKNTVFPTTYSRVVHGSIYVFVFFLPFGLVNVPAVGLVVTSLILSFAFLMIDRISTYLQDPFSNRPSDTPMLGLSRTIEINIKQMLGKQDLPQPLAPEDGVLY